MKFRLAQTVVDALAADKKEGHPIPCFDFKTFVARVPAERGAAVVDSGLREKRKEELPEGVKAENEVGDVRKDVGAQELDKPFGTRCELEQPVGRLQKVLRILKPLLVVSRKKFPARLSLQNHRQL